MKEITKELLEDLYLKQDCRLSEIAEKLNCGSTKVFRLLKKFGIEKSKEQISKRRQNTNLRKYGYHVPIGNEKVKEKFRQTCIQRYGVDNYSKTIEKREAASIFLKDRWQNTSFRENVQETCIQRYGVDNFAKSKEYQELIRKGIPQKKRTESLKKNNSFNISKPEEQAYQLLLTKFEKQDILRQYRSELYPFNCDFYIKSLDLYIEYQGSWTHGKYKHQILGAYDPKNKNHQKILKIWENKIIELGSTTNKGGNFYSTAVDRWTKLDPLKRETAKKNNLNFKEFWSVKEVKDWLKEL